MTFRGLLQEPLRRAQAMRQAGHADHARSAPGAAQERQQMSAEGEMAQVVHTQPPGTDGLGSKNGI